jgi:aspartyl-tRNA(Asn)/glutamyl-tRNA(Gln) amidotransferase subunit B
MAMKEEKKAKYIPTIGLEIHAELATKSKMFCSCKNDPDEEQPNVNICPVCMGHPGTLPVLNREAIRHVLKMGHAVGGTIADFTEWDRKNYFYPDIPKGYQISQYKYPLVTGGAVAGISITRIHLEEDTAQSTHDAPGVQVADKSLVNFNRAGVPLMELVTEPVIHDAATAGNFARELQLLLRYLGAGEANMQKGEMRVEANISVASPEDTAAGKFGTKTEVKNLNSFRFVERAIEYEIERQVKTLETGEKIIQETRGWDDAKQKTFSQRAKESSHDYRYFPDPDIPKMKVSEVPEFAPEVLKKEMPELPSAKRMRYAADYGMTTKEIAVFVDIPEISSYFEKTISSFAKEIKLVRLAINYILTDYIGLLKKEFGEGSWVARASKIKTDEFAALVRLTGSGKINSRGAKDTLAVMYENAGTNPGAANDPEKIANEKGLIQKDIDLKPIVEKIVVENPTVAADYKAGKQAALQFFIGQGMKASKGSANPEALKAAFIAVLG